MYIFDFCVIVKTGSAHPGTVSGLKCGLQHKVLNEDDILRSSVDLKMKDRAAAVVERCYQRLP